MIRLLDEQLANMLYNPSVRKPAKYSSYPPQTADGVNKQVIILKNPRAIQANISPPQKEKKEHKVMLISQIEARTLLNLFQYLSGPLY